MNFLIKIQNITLTDESFSIKELQVDSLNVSMIKTNTIL